MKTLTALYHGEKIAFEVRLCSSIQALQRHWKRIPGDGGVFGFCSTYKGEDGWTRL